LPLLYSKETNLKVEIVEYAFEKLKKELGTMQTRLYEVELEHNELCEKLHGMKIKIEVLEHDNALLKAKRRATEVKKEHFNSMKDVEHYHQILIHMKEQYQRNVEEFAKMTQLTFF
jgi:hypothetical protein